MITPSKETLLAIALVCLALSAVALAQNPSPSTAKPPGPTVELSLIVTDANNKSLDTINKTQIRVVENNVEQTVLSVAPDQRPVDCGIAIDASGSFRRLMGSTIEAAKFIVVNRQPKDEIFLERFISTEKIQRLNDFSRDVDVLTAAIGSIQVEGGQSAVIDALYTAAHYVAEHNRGLDRRKVLVVFTDGEDRKSSYNLDKLLKLLLQEKVQIFAIGLTMDLDEHGSTTRMSSRDKAEKLLNTLTEETGGRVFYPKDKSELNGAIAQIVHDLQGQFRITYQSSTNGQKDIRNVDVKLLSPSGEKRKGIVSRGYESKL